MNPSTLPKLFRRLVAAYHFKRAQVFEQRGQLASAHRHFAASARWGGIAAAYRIGLNYSSGYGCTRSGSQAVHWFTIAAEAGQIEAQFELGVALLADHDAVWCAGLSAKWAEMSAKNGSEAADLIFPNGFSVRKDDGQAFRWLFSAAKSGKAEAQANLGWLLLKGIGCEQNTTEAVIWFSEADRHDISQASLGLAEIFGNKASNFYDFDKYRHWLTRSANLGNASAAYLLGSLIKNSSSNVTSFNDVIRYFTLAAEKQHAGAAYELGVIIARDSSTEDEFEVAARHLRSAAKAGHVEAAVLLGELYSRGDRIRPDYREAAQWFRRAADSGHTQAQFQTACLFARGEGFPKDLKHAAKYFKLSADSGHPTAAFNLAVFYEKGDGVDEDIDRAIAYLKFAASKGLSQAQLRLAYLLNSGRGGVVDKATAARLLELAASQQNAEAEVALAFFLIEERQEVNINRVDALLASAVSKGHIGAAELTLARPAMISDRNTSLAAIGILEDAVINGSVRASLLIAKELVSGRYVSKDDKRAEELLLKASESDDPAANFELGVFYCKRKRDSFDLKSGLEYYIRAANLGHPLAQFNAGVMLLNGSACDPDLAQATRLLTEASNQGIEQAGVLIGKIGQFNKSPV